MYRPNSKDCLTQRWLAAGEELSGPSPPLFGYYLPRMDAESNHSSERMFLPNLNVYLTCVFVLGSLFSSTEVTALPRAFLWVAVLMTTHSLEDAGRSSAIFWFYYYFFALLLGIVWLAKGLSPRIRNPERERRYRLGHLLLIGANILGILGILLLFFHHRSLGNEVAASEMNHQPINAAMAFMLICAPIGLYMIWSSRQRPEPD